MNSTQEHVRHGTNEIEFEDSTYRRLTIDDLWYIRPGQPVLVCHDSDIGGHPLKYNAHITDWPTDGGSVWVEVDVLREYYGDPGIKPGDKRVEEISRIYVDKKYGIQ